MPLGSERYGLVASSKANRLKPEAIDVRVNIDPVHWFLNDAADTRSSYYLEDAATEFQGPPRLSGRLQRLPGDRARLLATATRRPREVARNGYAATPRLS